MVVKFKQTSFFFLWGKRAANAEEHQFEWEQVSYAAIILSSVLLGCFFMINSSARFTTNFDPWCFVLNAFSSAILWVVSGFPLAASFVGHRVGLWELLCFPPQSWESQGVSGLIWQLAWLWEAEVQRWQPPTDRTILNFFDCGAFFTFGQRAREVLPEPALFGGNNLGCPFTWPHNGQRYGLLLSTSSFLDSPFLFIFLSNLVVLCSWVLNTVSFVSFFFSFFSPWAVNPFWSCRRWRSVSFKRRNLRKSVRFLFSCSLSGWSSIFICSSNQVLSHWSWRIFDIFLAASTMVE